MWNIKKLKKAKLTKEKTVEQLKIIEEKEREERNKKYAEQFNSSVLFSHRRHNMASCNDCIWYDRHPGYCNYHKYGITYPVQTGSNCKDYFASAWDYD